MLLLARAGAYWVVGKHVDHDNDRAAGSGRWLISCSLFFKTDPTATPWFLKQNTGSALAVTASAAPAFGPIGLTM